MAVICPTHSRLEFCRLKANVNTSLIPTESFDLQEPARRQI